LIIWETKSSESQQKKMHFKRINSSHSCWTFSTVELFCRSWHAEHFCSLNLTSNSYCFWNKGRQVLKFWKFDEKRAITPKWVIGFIKNCRVGRSWHAAHCCNLNLTFISYSFWNKGRKELKFWKCDEKRTITPKWELGFIQKLQGR
jgi:hypothetical protein